MGKEAFDILNYKAPETSVEKKKQPEKQEKKKTSSELTKDDFDLVKGSADEQKSEMMETMLGKLPENKQDDAVELLRGKLSGTENQTQYEAALKDVLAYFQKQGETIDQQEDKKIDQTIEEAEKKTDEKSVKKGRFTDFLKKMNPFG